MVRENQQVVMCGNMQINKKGMTGINTCHLFYAVIPTGIVCIETKKNPCLHDLTASLKAESM